MLDYSWLWLNEELSDVKIRLQTLTRAHQALSDQEILELVLLTRQDECRALWGQPEAATGGKASGPEGAADNAHSHSAVRGDAADSTAHGVTTDTALAGDTPVAAAAAVAGNILMAAAWDSATTAADENAIDMVASANALENTAMKASGYWKARLLRWRSCKGSSSSSAAAVPAAAAGMPGMDTAVPAAMAARVEQAEQVAGVQASNQVNTAAVAAADCCYQVRKRHKAEQQEEGAVRPMGSQLTTRSIAVQTGPDAMSMDVAEPNGLVAERYVLQHGHMHVPVEYAEQQAYMQLQMSAQEVDTAAAAVRLAISSASADAMTDALVEQLDSEAGLDAAYSVLQHAYTQQFPKDATVEQLMQMAVQADRWDMPQCVGACLDRAATIKHLTVYHVNALLDDGWPHAIKAHASFKALVSNCAAALLRQFGKAQAVVANPQDLTSFCSLGLNAVQLWAQQDGLRVDSENTVAVLLTLWFLSNFYSINVQNQFDAARTALTGSIRAGQLTSTFLLFTLEKLPWFNPSPDAAAVLKITHSAPPSELSDRVRRHLPGEWVKEEREYDEDQDTVIEWAVTKAILDQLHADAAEDYGAHIQSPDNLYWYGYRWSIGLSLDSQRSSLWVGVKYHSALPEDWGPAGSPPVLPARFEIIVKGVAEQKFRFMGTDPMQGCLCGTGCLLGVPATTEPRANSYPPDNYWKDGKLHLKVKMLEVS